MRCATRSTRGCSPAPGRAIPSPPAHGARRSGARLAAMPARSRTDRRNRSRRAGAAGHGVSRQRRHRARRRGVARPLPPSAAPGRGSRISAAFSRGWPRRGAGRLRSRNCRRGIVQEGAGDCIWDASRGVFWAGYGPRSDVGALAEIANCFGVPVLGLELATEHYYHLDTCFCALPGGEVALLSAARSRRALGALIEEHRSGGDSASPPRRRRPQRFSLNAVDRRPRSDHDAAARRVCAPSSRSAATAAATSICPAS